MWNVLKKKQTKGKSPRSELNRKPMAYHTWSITATLQAAHQLHDKLTFLFKLRDATRPNVGLMTQ